jgi:hypothetical protein
MPGLSMASSVVDPKSDRIHKFWPNPKKSSYSDLDPDTVVKQNFLKNRRFNKKKKVTFFSWKTFSSVVQIPEHI